MKINRVKVFICICGIVSFLLTIFLFVSCDDKQKEPEVKTYKVTFDYGVHGNRTEPEVKEVKEGETVEMPENPTTTTPGFHFVGWYEDSEKFNPDTLITRDYYLTANWMGSIIRFDTNYTVTFNVDGNPSLVDSQAIKKNEHATKPTYVPTNKYKTFLYWSSDGTSEFNFEETGITDDTTLKAVWKEHYTIGGIGPAGGYIFYDCDADNTEVDAGEDNLHSAICGWRFLEAAPTDLKGDYYIFGFYREGSSNAVVGTSAKIGKGLENTEKLVKAMGEEEAFSSDTGGTKAIYAAVACYDYVSIYHGTAFDDWFLPSKGELNQMYINLRKNDDKDKSKYAFNAARYWSSTEVESEYWTAWQQSFFMDYGGISGGTQGYGNRGTSNQYRVRPVRRF